MYYYRFLNDVCDMVRMFIICFKFDQKDCIFKKDLSKFYCINYINIVIDVFGIKEDVFFDSLLQFFLIVFCVEVY